MGLNSKQTLAEVLSETSVFLNQVGYEGANAQAYWMSLFDWDLNQLVSHLRQPVDPQALAGYQDLIKRLIAGEPLQYIVGYADFNGYRLKVTPDTLIPREDSYGLIEIANQFLANKETGKVLDIGTGSGALAIVISDQHPQAQVSALDISPAALAVAQANGQAYHTQINWYESDLFEALTQGQVFDVIIANPPYISHEEVGVMDESVLAYEPHLALFADHDGLLLYERIASELSQWLSPNGMAAFEVGFKQAGQVITLFREAFPQAKIWSKRDLHGIERFVVVDLSGEED